MSFLVPLFLLGIAGVAIPVAVHLTRKQRRQVVHFPSLMFLEKIPYQEQRRRRIQHWFLLSLRAIALTLLAVAFARPFLADDEAGVLAGSGPREVVVLFDQSYSMAIGDQLQRAKGEATAIFGQMGPLDRASLVTFDQGARVLVRSDTDPARLRGAVDTVRTGSGTTRFGPALKVAQTILEESTLPSGEVFLVSDFQRSGWTGDEGVRLPAGSVVTPVPVGGTQIDNVQVTGVSLPRQAVSGRERITPTARLVRRGGERAEEITVALELDGQEIQSRPVTVQPNSATTVTFQPFTLSRPHTRGTVRVPRDGLPADDTHHFVLSPGTALTVLVVGVPVGTDDPNLYLTNALSVSDDGRFRVRTRRAATLRPVDLEGVDAVILNDIRLDGASAERLRSWVEAGGGLLVAMGERGAWPASALDMLPGTVGSLLDRIQGRGGRLGYLDYDHPIFEIFSGPRSGDFSNARFYRVRDFRPSDNAHVVARFDDGAVALAEGRRGRGSVAVWTTTLDSYWNDLPLQPVYLPFVHRVAEYLGGRTEATPWFTSGQVIDLADPVALETAGLVSSEAAGLVEGLDQVALAPSGGSLPLPAGGTTRYLPLNEQGFYTIRPPGSDPDRPFVIAVNVDLEESDLAGIDPEELVAQLGAPSAGPTSPTGFSGDLGLQREEQERRQSLWRWILVGALGLLILETALSNLRSRRPAGAHGAVMG